MYKSKFSTYCSQVTNDTRQNKSDRIQLNRTKGSDFLTASVSFGFHCSCIVRTPATDNGLKRFQTEYHHRAGDPRALEQKNCMKRKEEHSDFLIVKLSFVLYLTTQESTSEAGLLPVTNSDTSKQALNTSH
ncbi:hypothetical protein ABVT39_020317 [Epinephelus coioides]